MKTSVKRAVKSALYVTILLLTSNAIRIASAGARTQSISAVPAGTVVVPYTVVLTETVFGSAGQRVSAPGQTWALRSDGARFLKIGDGEKSTRQILFPSAVQVDVSDVRRAKSSVQRSVQDSWILDPRENCTKSVTGGAVSQNQDPPIIERVAGYRAAKITSDTTTRWLAIDHGCALIKRIMDFGAQGSSHLELVSLIPGEPSEALFRIPADYKEGPPSSLASPPSEKCNADCRESQRAHFERLDMSYYKHRVQ